MDYQAMDAEGKADLNERMRDFALQVIRLYSALPKTTVAQVIGKQMLRAGTSVGAHYCEGTRSRSDAEFVSKLEGAQQELAETIYWFDLATAESLAPAAHLGILRKEADELTAILVASVKTVKTQACNMITACSSFFSPNSALSVPRFPPSVPHSSPSFLVPQSAFSVPRYPVCRKPTAVTRTIAATDSQIDAMVYELYGLTEEET